MATRPSSRMARKLAKPRPRSPSRFSAGTRQSVKRQPVGVRGVPAHLAVRRLDLEARACRPGRRWCGSRACRPPGASVRAVTVTIEVMSVPELVMNAFSPLMHPLAGGLVEHGLGAGAAGVAAGVGLGQAEAAERPAGAQVGQPALALLLGAEVEDRVGAEADAGLERDRHRLVDPGELLDGHAQGGEVGAAAAVLLGERAGRRGRARPWPGPCRRGRCGRGPTPRRAGRSRSRRSPARPCGTAPARR